MKNISIGIVSFVYGTNYGCILQRHALQTILRHRFNGVESLAFPIPYMGKKSSDSRCNHFFSSRFPTTLKKVTMFIPRRLFYFYFEKPQIKQRENKFAEFERRFLVNTRRLNFYDDVQKEGERFDVLVAGSDQIWNTTWYGGEVFFQYYMLDFVPCEKKISYAASIGLSQIPDEYVPKFQRYLSDFTWLSVRENEGAKELERILNRPVDVVLDPTMLLSLEEWDVISNRYPTNEIQESPYILCYALGNQESVVRKARQIQKYRDVPILYLCTTMREYMSLKLKHSKVKPILNAGPGEFVSLFKNAAYVVTDSFHGSVFSILYHKPFFTMMRDKADPTKSMNSRMTTLFSTFHLESRLFSPEDKTPLTSESFEIDYEAVDKILQERREFSINKLREAIENVVNKKADA